MFSEIQPNTFSSPFSIFSENENRKQPNQTPPYLLWLRMGMDIYPQFLLGMGADIYIL